MEYKTSEAERRAKSEYRKRNRELEKIKTYRRTAKMFIRKHADVEQLLELEEILLEQLPEVMDEECETQESRKSIVDQVNTLHKKFNEEES